MAWQLQRHAWMRGTHSCHFHGSTNRAHLAKVFRSPSLSQGAGPAPHRPRHPPRRRGTPPAPRSAPDASGAAAPPLQHPDWRALLSACDPLARERERSALVNEEIVYLIFQLELDSQLQRALNYEAYEAAQQVRAKRETVDQAIRQMRERKGATAGGQHAEVALSMSDLAAEGLRLRSEMQRAAEEERYADASRYRDLLAELDRRSKLAAAAAASSAPPPGGGPRLALGARVVHVTAGYRGVVVGWDVQCCEDEAWVEASGAAGLPHGLAQPFYHVLVDARDWDFDARHPPVAYVAQELLHAPADAAARAAEAAAAAAGDGEAAEGGRGRGGEVAGCSWREVYGEDELQHPYSYVLFLGADARGDLLPCRQLRDKYSAPRRDVYGPGSEGSDDGEEGDSGGGDGPRGGGGGGGPWVPGIDMTSLG